MPAATMRSGNVASAPGDTTRTRCTAIAASRCRVLARPPAPEAAAAASVVVAAAERLPGTVRGRLRRGDGDARAGVQRGDPRVTRQLDARARANRQDPREVDRVA